MKSVLFVFCLFCALGAFGQSVAGGSAISADARPTEFASHTEFATQQPMSQELNLREPSSATAAKGERPLWEVAPLPRVLPLGDVARLARKAHLTAKKSETVWVN